MSDYGLGVYAVLFAAVVWGTTGTAARFAPEVGPIAIGAAAMGVGGLCQAALAARAIRGGWARIVGQPGLLWLGAFAVAIYPLAFYSAMQFAGVTVGTIITLGTAPLFAAVIEWGLDRVRLTRRWALSAGLGVIGMVMLALAKMQGMALVDAAAVTGAAPILGMVAGLLGGLTYALYSWTARRMMLGGASAQAAMGATFGLGGLLLVPVLVVTGAPFLASGQNFAVGAYMALVPMTLGYIAFGIGLARIPASMATTLTLFEPVVAAFLALWLLGERLPAMGWVGVALIAGCLVLLTAPVKKTAKSPAKNPVQ